jgi:hypothetical protein
MFCPREKYHDSSDTKNAISFSGDSTVLKIFLATFNSIPFYGIAIISSQLIILIAEYLPSVKYMLPRG